MSQLTQILDLKGLVTHPSVISQAPQGSLSIAQNVVLDKESVVESRRGQTQYGIQLTDSYGTAATIENIYTYNNVLVVRASTASEPNFLAYDSGNGVWLRYDGYSLSNPNSNTQVHALESNQNIYFNTGTGTYKLDSFNDYPKLAGAPQGLDGYLQLTNDGYGFLDSNAAVAYRIVWGYNDLNNNEILGAPSGRAIITNSPATVTISSFTGNQFTVGSSTPNIAVGDTITQTSISDTVTASSGATITVANVDNWADSQITVTRTVNITAVSGTSVTLSASPGASGTLTGYTLVQSGLTGTVSSASGSVLTMAASYTFTVGQAQLIHNDQSISSFNGNQVTVSSGASAVANNSTLYQNGTQYTITSVSGNVLTLNGVYNWVVGASAYIQYTANVIFQATIPSGVTSNYFYQVYRSDESAIGVPGSGYFPTPDDNCNLIYQGTPTSTDFSNGYIKFTDLVPNSLNSGTALYTNANQQGINQSNYRPPLAVDFDLYQGYVFFGNTQQPQTIEFTLTAVGSPNGIQAGDTVTIGGVVYTAGTTASPTTGVFQVFSTVSPGYNIQQTTLSLVQAINRYTANTQYYGYYNSSPTSLPGQITLLARYPSTPAFALNSTRTTAWNPPLPSTGSSVISTGQVNVNAVFFSKEAQPEAVPLLNYLLVGSANKPIRRVLALRDALFVLKDDGVYRITGTDPTTFDVSPLDTTVIVKVPESAVKFNNQIYCFSTQGVIAISDTGVSVVSRAIEDVLFTLYAFPNFSTLSFGVSYESDRKYILFTPTYSTDTYATQAFVYNSFTNSWTNWVLPRTCGVVNNGPNLLYMATPLDGYVRQERKNSNSTDYADEQYPITITSFSGTTVNFTSPFNTLETGYSISQNFISALIETINSGPIGSGPYSYSVTVDTALQWVLGSAEFCVPIQCVIQTNPLHCGSPTQMKQFMETQLIFRNASFDNVNLNFNTDLDNGNYTQNLVPVISPGPWGNFVWGVIPWGGFPGGQQVIRGYVPLQPSRARWLQITVTNIQCFTSFSIEGINLLWNAISFKTR